MTYFRILATAALAAGLAITPTLAAQAAPEAAPSPREIVAAAPADDWRRIAPDDLLVMTLAPDMEGHTRRVVIQLMPPPFSQGWVSNIRTLARAHWWDGLSVNRVQDNYVVQWGDPNLDNPEATDDPKPLPESLEVMQEDQYTVDGDVLGEVFDLEDAEAYNPAITAMLNEATPENPVTGSAVIAAVLADLAANDVDRDKIANISIKGTRTEAANQGWHERDSVAEWVEIWRGWPIANYQKAHWEDEAGNIVQKPVEIHYGNDLPEDQTPQVAAEEPSSGPYRIVDESRFWPIHCYGMVGVGRNYSPDTGSGAELYAVIGHAPRHLDRNIALVGRVIEGMEHLSSLPRGKGDLGFYTDPARRTPIISVRLASDLPQAQQPAFEYLDTESEAFARYVAARANRRDPFFIVPAGGVDICNIPVPIRAVPQAILHRTSP